MILVEYLARLLAGGISVREEGWGWGLKSEQHLVMEGFIDSEKHFQVWNKQQLHFVVA